KSSDRLLRTLAGSTPARSSPAIRATISAVSARAPTTRPRARALRAWRTANHMAPSPTAARPTWGPERVATRGPSSAAAGTPTRPTHHLPLIETTGPRRWRTTQPVGGRHSSIANVVIAPAINVTAAPHRAWPARDRRVTHLLRT